MTTPNTPGPGEWMPEAANNKRFRKSNLSDILDTALEEMNWWNKPDLLNSYEKDKDWFVTKLRVRLKKMRDDAKSGWTTGDGWWTITDREIDELSISDINKKIVLCTKPLISLRSSLLYELKITYSHIRDFDDWESKIMQELKVMDREELSLLKKRIKNKEAIRKFFERTFWEPVWEWILTPESVGDMREIFYDIDTLWASSNQKADIEKMFMSFQRHRTIPDIWDIRELLFLYRNSSIERKRELLWALNIALPVSFAKKNNLLSDREFDTILSLHFGVIYTWLDIWDKKSFQDTLLDEYDNHLMVSIQDIETSWLGALLWDKYTLNTLAESIQSRLYEEREPNKRPEADILKAAAEKYPNEDDHQIVFNRYVASSLRNTEDGASIPGIDSLAKESIVEFGDWDAKMRFRILQTHDESGFPLEVNSGLSNGLRIEELPVVNGYLKRGGQTDLTYDALYGFFKSYNTTAKVISKVDFEKSLVSTPSEIDDTNNKLYDARELETEGINRTNIIAKIDDVNPEWREYGWEIGTYFSAPEEEKAGIAEVRIWKVVAIWDEWVEILSEGGTSRERIWLPDIYALAQAKRLKRIGKVESDADLISLLSKNHGVASDASIDDGQISQKNKDTDGKDTSEIMRVFADGDGAHIRISGIQDGMIGFGEYVYDWGEVKASEFAEKNGSKKAFKSFYKQKYLTYGAFLEYLKKNKMKSSSHDIIDDHTHSKHDHDHSHMEGSFFSRLGKMQSIGSMWKGLEMVWHSIEHTLEKWSKLDAAKFAMKVGKFLPGDSIEAQLYADIVDGSKEIVEKIKNKITNLPGPKWRLKCIHIAHNRDARPEEVMAAIQFMVSGYGHLYAEDIRQYQSVVTRSNLKNKPQWYFAFLDNFIHTSGLPWGDGKSPVIYWREKAYEKAKPELGNQGEPPEELLLHALFKSIEGNPEKYPYAASVVKAIGGPGGFEKDWKFEGTKNAIQKGKDQTTMVDAQWRLNKAIGYLATHEFNKGTGAMEKVAGKVKDPGFQAFPFVWAVWGYSKYASPTALQDIKNYAQNGLSFHGYAFLQKEEHNTLYRETVRLAVIELVENKKMSRMALDDFNSICDRMDQWPESQETTDNKYKKKSPPKAMMEWWQAYQWNGLNDMLQGHDGWLSVKSKTNNTIQKYRANLIGQHTTQLRDGNIPGTDYGKDWYDEHGLGLNQIMRDSAESPGMKSVESSLNKIKFGGTNRWGRPMDTNNKEKIWSYLKNTINANRSIDAFYGNEELQKEQFKVWRRELITYFNRELSAWEVKDEGDILRLINTPGYEYFQDFLDMGIDPMSIFKLELIKSNEESDFQAWKSGGRVKWAGSQNIIDAVKWKASWAQWRWSRGSTYQDPDTLGQRGPAANDADWSQAT